MRRIILPSLLGAGLAANALAEKPHKIWLADEPGAFAEFQAGYARLDRTDRDFVALSFDAGMMMPMNDRFAHDLRLQLGYIGHQHREHDRFDNPYTRGTLLCPVTVGYTLHAVLPGRAASLYAGPRAGGVFAQVYESEHVGHDIWGDPIYDEYSDSEVIFTWGGDAGVLIHADKNVSIDLGYSYRHLDGTDFKVRGRGEVWPSQGLHMIRIGITGRF